MEKVIGFCNLHDNPRLGGLTESRPIGAVTFLGRYGLMDFTLSNFSNSGINQIYTLVEYGAFSIRSHIRTGNIWIQNTKTGFLALNMNEKGLGNRKFNTDVANINATIPFGDLDFDDVVIAPSCFLANLDFNPIIKEHREKGNDITIIYTNPKNNKHDYLNCDALTIKNELVTEVKKYADAKKDASISMEMFIITKEAFLKLLEEAKEVSILYSIRQMISYYANNHLLKVGAHEFKGYVAPILSVEHYVKYSFELLDYLKRCELFKPDWPIYTTTHDTQPAFYGQTAEVKNSFIANGCVIKGKVENSILSRNVRVEKGAVVKNSIIFSGSKIGEDAHLEYVVSDKGVTIRQVKDLKGTIDDVVFLKTGAKI